MKIRYYYGLTATVWLILINTLVFLFVLGAPGLIDLLVLEIAIPIALLPTYLLSHPWTFITSMFVHEAFWHISINMLVLFLVGHYLELMIRAKRFLVIYLASGIMGEIFFILFDVVLEGNVGCVTGASGAIFGVFTALAILKPGKRVDFYPFPFSLSVPVAIAIGFFVAMFVFQWEFAEVPNSAHLGGIFAGVILGLYFKKRIKKEEELYELGY